MRDLCFGLVVLLTVVCSADAVADAPKAGLGPTDKAAELPMITGVVLDSNGEPVAGMRISATTDGLGKTFYYAIDQRDAGGSMYEATTGPDGRFTIRVHYAGLVYRLYSFHAQTHRLFSEQVPVVLVPEEGAAEPIELTALPYDARESIVGRVLRSDGAPAAHQRVALKNEFGQSWHAKTDEAGRYRFGWRYTSAMGDYSVSVDAGQEKGYARVRSWGVVFEINAGDLQLAKTASVHGRVLAEDTGEPIAGAVVRFSAYGVVGLSWSTITGQDGRYELMGLPAGKYSYFAESRTHRDSPKNPNAYTFNRGELVLKPGDSAEVSSFHMLPFATVRGRFVTREGTPIPHAAVCWLTGHRQYDFVQTDGRGEFTFRTFKFDHSHNAMEAYHSIAGGGRQTIPRLKPGQVLDDVELVATGSAWVRGRVTDEQGKPIAGVNCAFHGQVVISALSDEQGNYDLGRVQLRPDGEDDKPRRYPMVFAPPRPNNHDWAEVVRDPGPFCTAEGHWLTPEVDERVVQDVALKRTGRLTVAGSIPKAKAMLKNKRARVYLLSGKVVDKAAGEKQELKRLLEDMDVRHHFGERGGVGLDREPSAIKPLLDTQVNDNHEWGFVLLRSDSDPRALQQIQGYYVKPREPGEERPGDLDWFTVLKVFGDGSYRLHEPIPVVPGRSRYVVPGEAGGE